MLGFRPRGAGGDRIEIAIREKLPLMPFMGQTIKPRDGCSRVFRIATFEEHMIDKGLAALRLEQIHPRKIVVGLSCYPFSQDLYLHPIYTHKQQTTS
jgi:hypothetical protein